MSQNKTITKHQPTFEIVLSREEVLVVLRAINQKAIPNLGNPPVSNLTQEQVAFSLTVAEQALQARGVAYINEDSNLLIQNNVLEAIGICALPQHALYMTHMSEPSSQKALSIAYMARNKWSLHTTSQPGLNLFSVYPSWESVCSQIPSLYDWSAGMFVDEWGFSASTSVLQNVRRLAKDDQAGAITRLIEDGVPAEHSEKLVDILTSPHSTTIFQKVSSDGGDGTAVKSVTVISQADKLVSLIESAPTESSASSIHVQATTSDTVLSILGEVMAK